MNRIEQLFEKKKENILSIYYTAGYPELEDTIAVLQNLQDAGVDLVEIGIPFSDPVADGPTIQASNQLALENGMSVKKLLQQLKNMRESITMPVLLMGYLNPIMQYGIERFCEDVAAIGVDGLIIPDLPMQAYQEEYKTCFEKNGLYNIFLITPQTDESRISMIDKESKGFIYMVSSASITGARSGISEEQLTYFQRVKGMQLKNPALIGFGISDSTTFGTACKYASGAIIGSAFVKLLGSSKDKKKDITTYINEVKGISSKIEQVENL